MLNKDAYLYPSGYEQIANESNDRYGLDIERGLKEGLLFKDEQGKIWIKPSNGIKLPITGATYPLKCYADANAVFATNMVKAIFIETIKIIKKWYFIPALLLVNKQKVLDSFNRIGMKIMSPHLLKDEYLTDFTKNLHLFIFTFLYELGFEEDSCNKFATIFSQVIEYDNAYRLRIEDIMSETSVCKLQNPRKEIRRLLKIMKERDQKGVFAKFNAVLWLVSLFLMIPKVKSAFLEAVNEVDFEKLGLDRIDTYWVCIRTDYKFMGMTVEERKHYMEDRGWNKPISL